MIPNTYSSACVALVKQFEGFEAKAYDDGAGHATVGYGHKIQPGETLTLPLSKEDGDALLKGDLGWAAGIVAANVRVTLNQNQFDALASFVFNIGAGDFMRSTLLELLNAGDYQGAAEQFARWDRIGIEPNAGLARRRAAEEALFNKEA